MRRARGSALRLPSSATRRRRRCSRSARTPFARESQADYSVSRRARHALRVRVRAALVMKWAVRSSTASRWLSIAGQDVATIIQGVVPNTYDERPMIVGSAVIIVPRWPSTTSTAFPTTRRTPRHRRLDARAHAGQAVVWAAFFNFIAVPSSSLRTSPATSRKGVDPSIVSHCLVGSKMWRRLPNFLTVVGSPTSSPHRAPGTVLCRRGEGCPALDYGFRQDDCLIVVARLGMALDTGTCGS